MPKIKAKKAKIKKEKSRTNRKIVVKKSQNSILGNNSLFNFIKSLKINPEQEKVLAEEIPQMDTGERIELFKALTDVYILNQQQDEAVAKLQANWQ